MANRSLNQVLMRSLNTSFVALLPVTSLLVVGVGLEGALALREFGLALFIGLIVGAVLVDLRRHAAARLVEGARAALPRAGRAQLGPGDARCRRPR